MVKGKESILGNVPCYALGRIHRNHNAIFWSECLHGPEEEEKKTIYPKSLYLQRKKIGVNVGCCSKPCLHRVQIPCVNGCALGLQSCAVWAGKAALVLCVQIQESSWDEPRSFYYWLKLIPRPQENNGVAAGLTASQVWRWSDLRDS